MFSFFKKSRSKNEIKSREDILSANIISIKHNSKFFDKLAEILNKDGYKDLVIVNGEHCNMDDEVSKEVCIDSYFYDDKQMYMLSIYENGIVLLKEVNTESDDLHDLVTVFSHRIKKSFLSTLVIPETRIG
ncbi:hypothetical protein [Aliarcobacter butzleri]|uniref:hypothetical protein n=1 Tax=Aliarcobacter butzleri TaxID=28197 RepID=UPI0012698BB9|nr:hypothetical protein [Aliarcobacter butzleri]